jgi:hypothetical protein
VSWKSRYQYGHEAVEAVEKDCCSLGCRVPLPTDVEEFGPGGCCPVLAEVALSMEGDTDSETITERSGLLRCSARVPLKTFDEELAESGQLDLLNARSEEDV